jgi:hypothetical protein
MYEFGATWCGPAHLTRHERPGAETNDVRPGPRGVLAGRAARPRRSANRSTFAYQIGGIVMKRLFVFPLVSLALWAAACGDDDDAPGGPSGAAGAAARAGAAGAGGRGGAAGGSGAAGAGAGQAGAAGAGGRAGASGTGGAGGVGGAGGGGGGAGSGGDAGSGGAGGGDAGGGDAGSGGAGSGGAGGGVACVPVEHATQGVNPDTSVQRYRFVSGAGAGDKVALLFSHFGPSSLAPFVNLHAYEAGADAAFYGKSLFAFGPALDEGVLAELETSIVDQARGDLVGAGLPPGENVPRALRWCQGGDTVYVDDGGAAPRAYALRVESQPCPTPNQPARTRWSLCDAADPSSCVVEATQSAEGPECLGADVALVDVYRAGGTLWAVAERRVMAFTDLPFFTRSLGSSR